MVNFRLGKRIRERCFSSCPGRVKKKKNKIKEREKTLGSTLNNIKDLNQVRCEVGNIAENWIR